MPDKHFEAVVELANWSWERRRPDREVHQFILQHLTGEYHPSVWSRDGKRGIETSLPLLSLAYRAMSRHIVSKSPRIMATIADPSLKPFVETQQIRTNKRMRQSGLDAELMDVAGHSLVSCGILFMAPQYVGTPNGMSLDLKAESIDPCRFFSDPNAARYDLADIQGDEFEMPLADVQDNPMFGDARGDVTPDGKRDDRDRGSNLNQDNWNHPDIYKMVTIRRCYERRRNKLYYWPKNQPKIKLAEIDWLGPRKGPYKYLWFERPPGTATPTAPLLHLLKTHRAFNYLDVRAMHQQQVAKALLAYTSAGKGEAERVLKSPDLWSVLMENGTVRWVHIGGASQSTVAMAEQMKARFSYANSGILDQFMQQADTLGQERLTRGAVNEVLDDMSEKAYAFVKDVATDWFWFDVRDPSSDQEWVRKPFPGLRGESYEVLWTPQHRQFVSELEYEVDVEPYSYVDRSPQAKLADLLGAHQILMGMVDVLASQGIAIDGEAIIRTIADLKNLPELYDWYILNQDPEKLSQLLGARGQHSPMDSGQKRYIRRSESDGSGQQQEVMRMFGKQQNETEAA